MGLELEYRAGQTPIDDDEKEGLLTIIARTLSIWHHGLSNLAYSMPSRSTTTKAT